jgi:hypothetical protein
MADRKRCNILSYDYLDMDVYWNIKLFYLSAGFDVETNATPADHEVLVLLRGNPGDHLMAYRGSVHVYDYVKELTINWRAMIPLAREIIVVSLSRPAYEEGVALVAAYLPIIPELWQHEPFRKRPQRPFHISNFKPIHDDPYQRDLIELGRHELIQIHGNKWDQVDIRAHGLSYWQANKMLAWAYSCYGLMYPYQRGTTLSGRMWQAPLLGCFVISEKGTNPFGCPGVIEVDRFSPETLLLVDSIKDCWDLRRRATRHWRAVTLTIARGLGWDGGVGLCRVSLARVRREMWRHHLHFTLRRQRSALAGRLSPPFVHCFLRRNQRRVEAIRGRLPLPWGRSQRR